jgi:TetR/AcrR family transcriptional regulator
MPSSPNRRENGQDQDPKQRILNAARFEFIEHGFAGAKMRPIALKAKVNSALLHYYFRNKESLYQSALLDIIHSVWGGLDSIDPPPSSEQPLPDLLRSLLRRYFDIVMVTPEFPRFLLREILEGGKHLPLVVETISTRYGSVIQAVTQILKKEIESGHFRPITLQDFFLNLAGLAISSVLFSLTTTPLKLFPTGHSFQDPKWREKRIEEILRTLFDGLGVSK